MKNQDYEKYADNLIYDAQNVVVLIGDALVELQESIIKDPENINKYRKIYEKKVDKIAKNFDMQWKQWADNDLAASYISGIKDAEKTLKSLGKQFTLTDKINNGNILLKDFPPPPGIPEISGQVSLLFSGKYADHKTFFGTFRQSAYYSLEGQQLQIMRAADDIFRQTSIMAGEKYFSEADIFTRRKFSQEMLDQFAKNGIKTITYKNGARYSIDTYCETVGRTLSAHCGIQANLNRLTQSGYDLVIVSAHFRACEMCIPYENTVLSINGNHPYYESMSDAIRNGLFHCNCYSNDTEVYTSNGWKLFKDVNGLDEIFSLNPDSHIPEWIKWIEKFKYIENEMIEFKSNSFDLLVTKNHNMYIGTNSHAGNKKKVIKWKIELAENCLTKNFKQLRCVNWKGLDLDYDTFEYTKKEFAFLLGIYMAEGCVEKNRNDNIGRITISQYKESGIKDIEKILKPMGFYFSGNRFIKDNVKLAKYLKKFGKSHEKYIPKYILNEKPEIIKEFLRGFLIGDGSVTNNISKLGFNSISKSYFTSSKKLADQIGECILKIGKYPSFNLQKTKGKTQIHKNGTYICNHDMWRIHENNSKMSYHNVSKSNNHRGIQSKIIDDYNELVYCLELEKYHIMLVRRNGKIAWCGNCVHDVSAFFEDITPEIQTRVNPYEQDLIDNFGYGEAQKLAYEAQQRQRQIERNIRTWKRRKSVSLDDKTKNFASQKVSFWQKQQRDHLNENKFLNRKYEREQIKKAH